MEVTTSHVFEELAAMGVDVQPFSTRGSNKQFIWNEVRIVVVDQLCVPMLVALLLYIN